MKYAVILMLFVAALTGCKKDRSGIVEGDYIVSGYEHWGGPGGPSSHIDTLTNKMLHISASGKTAICENVVNLCPAYNSDESSGDVYVLQLITSVWETLIALLCFTLVKTL